MTPEDEADARENASRSPADLRRTDAVAWALILLACALVFLACAAWVALYLSRC